MLAKKPTVSFVSRQPRTVNPRLLPGSDADGLAVQRIANRIGLRIFEGDKGN